MKTKEKGHDCAELECYISLDGIALSKVEIVDGFTGALLQTVLKGDSMPVLPVRQKGEKLADYRGRLPNPFKNTRPFTRKVA